MKKDKIFNQFIKEWTNDLGNTNQCPYAKAAYDRDRIKQVITSSSNAYDFWSTVYAEADIFDDTNDVVMIAMKTDNEIITLMQLSGGCDSFNGFCSNKNIDLWALNLHEDLYTIVLLQRLSKLDNASKLFEDKGYYNDYGSYMYNKFVLARRKLRNKLITDTKTT